MTTEAKLQERITELTNERDAYQIAADDLAAECKALRDGSARVAAQILDAGKAWAEYQERMRILRLFEEDEK